MISVVIACFNGQAVLPKTLVALCSLDKPSQEVEFIIVDNASTDDTRKILDDFVDKLPLKIMSESQTGKIFAINKGLVQARGELIVFSDDDVIPSKDWLVEYEKVAQRQSDYSVFLGQVRPAWPRKPPKWLEQLSDDGLACGCTSKSLVEGPASINWAKGANFCVRREVMYKVSFRTDLWIAGDNPVGGEDTDFIIKAKAIGYEPWFVPQASLQHIIRLYEMTLKGISMRCFRIGRSMEVLDSNVVDIPKFFFGYPRWAFSKVFKQVIRMAVYAMKFDCYAAVRKMMEIATFAGRQYERKNHH
tara:strand:- start:9782 stop:10690 length:909 start_codon:yes stop_codon:yes gene_type:complete